jgi:uncharacterized protein YfdQ (DUF2303 family)
MTATDMAPEAAMLSASSPFAFDLAEAARLGVEAGGVEIVEIAAPQGIPGLPDSVPAVLLRGGSPSVRSLADVLETYRLHPRRKQGTAEARTFDSFCDLVNRHRTGHSAIFADTDWKKPSFVAVVDYHQLGEDGRPDHLKHRIRYAFPLSDEWQAWIEGDGKPMDQRDFAWFLEDRVPELSSPTDHERVTLEHQFATTIATPAQLVELSRGLQVHADTRVKAVTVLQTGEGQVAWEESHNDADGKPLKVPGLFILSIAPFFMGETVRIPVRLRYRVTNGKVAWTYQIYRPDRAITEHVRQTLADARERTGLPAYEGAPEAGA